MKTIRRVITSGRHFLKECMYGSLACAGSWDAMRLALLLRMSPKHGDHDARRSPWKLRLRGYDHPLWLRPHTSDALVAREVLFQGEYDGIRQCELPDSARILDLGSNIGLSVCYWDYLFEQCDVIAVEPDDHSRTLLERNCQSMIEADRLHVVSAFISHEAGWAAIERPGRAWSYRMGETSQAQVDDKTIPTVTVPSLLEEADWDVVDLLKCDIEGGEVGLFQSAGDWVSRIRHMFVETHPPYTNEDLYADLRRAGYVFDVLHDESKLTNGVCLLRQR
ncbi:FkbM family methyltransferase [Phycisphaerales bacterium AB-hyl4]|uniref:FkbM family methyltransferase n=1 Tax=Natronomicrosphaera hydrolytica TaxID=3242702 RepID=A0ABV4UBB6_9BACT